MYRCFIKNNDLDDLRKVLSSNKQQIKCLQMNIKKLETFKKIYDKIPKEKAC